jgi:TrmH family RNA methyltransferase
MLLSNNKLKYFSSLKLKKNREKEQEFLVEGGKSVKEALKSNWNISAVLYTKNFINSSEFKNGIFKGSFEQYEVSERQLSKISDELNPQGIIFVVKKKSFNKGELKNCKFIVALDGISDPGNLGTIIRTCDWFGVDAILVSKNSVEVFNPKVIRATMGSIFHLSVFCDVDLRNELLLLKKSGFKIYSTSLNAKKNYNDTEFKEKKIFVFGNESFGISKEILEISDEKIKILSPVNRSESLNVSVSTGIILAKAILN